MGMHLVFVANLNLHGIYEEPPLSYSSINGKLKVIFVPFLLLL